MPPRKGELRTDYWQGDQEMGGLKPWAASALTKRIAPAAGTCAGAATGIGTSGQAVTATEWQNWQVSQVVCVAWGLSVPSCVAPASIGAWAACMS